MACRQSQLLSAFSTCLYVPLQVIIHMQTTEARIRATKRQKHSANANASIVVSSHVIDLSEDDDVKDLPAVSMGAPTTINLRGSNPTGAPFHRHRDQPCHVHSSAATETIGSQVDMPAHPAHNAISHCCSMAY